MKTYEITREGGNVALLIGDTKGGLTMIAVDAEMILSPAEAREIGEELIRAADEVEIAT